MSMSLMVQAMKAKVGNPLRKLVLIKLADNASDAGECWPSYQHIADQCEISKRSVILHINKLQEMGFVNIQHRDGAKGNSSNLYRLTIPSAAIASGGVQEIHHSSAGDSLGGGAGAAPRTSHSLESVTEPFPEFHSGSLMKKRSKKKPLTDFPVDFFVDEEMSKWYFEQEGFVLDLGEATQSWADGVRAKGYQYADWKMAWRNGVKNQNKWAREKIAR